MGSIGGITMRAKYITIFAHLSNEDMGKHEGTETPVVGYVVKKAKSYVYPTQTLRPPERFQSWEGYIPNDWSEGERKEWIEERMTEFSEEIEVDYPFCHSCHLNWHCGEH